MNQFTLRLFIITIGMLWSCAENTDSTGFIPPDVDRISDLSFGTDSTFEILSWNIENFPKNGTTTVEYAAQIIFNLNIDVVALQEIISNLYFELLIDELNEIDGINEWQGYKSNSASWDLDLAYIGKSDFDVYEIYDGGGDWWAFPRSPLVMDFNWQNQRIIIINNHLKANESGNEDEDRRQEASELLQEYIEINFHNDNVIVVGDWNDEIQEPEASNVFWNFIEEPDYYKFTDMEIAEDNTHFQWSFPLYPSHLDHILITNELFDEFENPTSEIKTIRVDDYLAGGFSDYDANISDHRPVSLKLKFE